MDSKDRFVFVGDNIVIPEYKKPIEIYENHFFQKATPSQVEAIQKRLSELGGNFFKDRFKVEKSKDFQGYQEAPEEEWKYWVISTSNNQVDPNVHGAMLLCEANLFPLFEIFPGMGFSHNYASGAFIHDEAFNFNERTVSLKELNDITTVVELLKGFNSNYKEEYRYIKKSLEDFRKLHSISKKYPFFILNMFSILEGLLLSNNSAYAKQLQTKINLLNNRFLNKINYKDYFPTGTYKKVIEQLYDYRSDIAHGDFSDFDRELTVIRDQSKILDYIYVILKSAILQAVKEPQLISDLKKC